MIIRNSDILILEDYREGGYGSNYILIWKIIYGGIGNE